MPDFLKAVSQAATQDALLGIVNEFLLHHPEEFWSWVPRESRPHLVATVEELHQWQRRLTEHLAEATMPNVRMQDVCVFFLRASARALEIAPPAPGGEEPCNEESQAPPLTNGSKG